MVPVTLGLIFHSFRTNDQKKTANKEWGMRKAFLLNIFMPYFATLFFCSGRDVVAMYPPVVKINPTVSQQEDKNQLFSYGVLVQSKKYGFFFSYFTC